MKSDIQQYRNKLLRKLSNLGVSQSILIEASELSQGRISQILENDQAPLSEGVYLGAPCKLSSNQQKKLKAYLDEGAESQGYEGEIWTSKRVKLLIQDKFKINYHPHHIPRLLKRLNYSLQVPKKEDYRRDPAAVENWKTEKIKEIKKKQSKKIEKSTI